MNFYYDVLATTKAGNQLSEMEDAHFPLASKVIEAERFVCAISDGATQGSHSGPWASVLTEEYVKTVAEKSADVFDEAFIAQSQATFGAWEKTYLAGREQAGRVLQWFEEAVIGSGAFATLVGLRVEAQGSQVHFHAEIVGDSCLFVVKNQAISQSFPMTESSQFAGAPLLVGSKASANTGVCSGLKKLSGDLGTGDQLILCTDAFSAWMIRETENGRNPVGQVQELFSAPSPEAFLKFVQDLRIQKAIRNDDIALVRVSWR